MTPEQLQEAFETLATKQNLNLATEPKTFGFGRRYVAFNTQCNWEAFKAEHDALFTPVDAEAAEMRETSPSK